MKCPDCSGPALILESRACGDTKRRRHQCSNQSCGIRFTSYEFITTAYTPTSVQNYLKFLRLRHKLKITEVVRLRRSWG